MVPDVRLHVPEEPVARRTRWRAEVLDGADLRAVVAGEDGIGAWLWARWRVLERAGLDRGSYLEVVAGYRRELWLWMAGDRTWEQCSAGLIGRLQRRLPA